MSQPDFNTHSNPSSSHLSITLEASKPLPNALREHLLQDHAKACFVLDLLYYLGVRRGYYLTYNSIKSLASERLGFLIPAALLRAGLNDTDIFTRAEPLRLGRGRPEMAYIVPDFYEVALKFNVSLDHESERADRLEHGDFASLCAYRCALHHTFTERNPGQISRAFQAARLGVSKRTIRRYDRRVRAGKRVNVYPNIERELFFGQHGLDGLHPRYFCEIEYMKRGGLLVRKRVAARDRVVSYWTTKHNASVWLCEQKPNSYYLDPLYVGNHNNLTLSAA